MAKLDLADFLFGVDVAQIGVGIDGLRPGFHTLRVKFHLVFGLEISCLTFSLHRVTQLKNKKHWLIRLEDLV